MTIFVFVLYFYYIPYTRKTSKELYQLYSCKKTIYSRFYVEGSSLSRLRAEESNIKDS